MSDNQNEKEENVFPWKEKMRQAGQGDTGSVLELCEEIRPIVEDFCRSRTFRNLFLKRIPAVWHPWPHWNS